MKRKRPRNEFLDDLRPQKKKMKVINALRIISNEYQPGVVITLSDYFEDLKSIFKMNLLERTENVTKSVVSSGVWTLAHRGEIDHHEDIGKYVIPKDNDNNEDEDDDSEEEEEDDDEDEKSNSETYVVPDEALVLNILKKSRKYLSCFEIFDLYQKSLQMKAKIDGFLILDFGRVENFVLQLYSKGLIERRRRKQDNGVFDLRRSKRILWEYHITLEKNPMEQEGISRSRFLVFSVLKEGKSWMSSEKIYQKCSDKRKRGGSNSFRLEIRSLLNQMFDENFINRRTIMGRNDYEYSYKSEFMQFIRKKKTKQKRKSQKPVKLPPRRNQKIKYLSFREAVIYILKKVADDRYLTSREISREIEELTNKKEIRVDSIPIPSSSRISTISINMPNVIHKRPVSSQRGDNCRFEYRFRKKHVQPPPTFSSKQIPSKRFVPRSTISPQNGVSKPLHLASIKRKYFTRNSSSTAKSKNVIDLPIQIIPPVNAMEIRKIEPKRIEFKDPKQISEAIAKKMVRRQMRKKRRELSTLKIRKIRNYEESLYRNDFEVTETLSTQEYYDDDNNQKRVIKTEIIDICHPRTRIFNYKVVKTLFNVQLDPNLRLIRNSNHPNLLRLESVFSIQRKTFLMYENFGRSAKKISELYREKELSEIQVKEFIRSLCKVVQSFVSIGLLAFLDLEDIFFKRLKSSDTSSFGRSDNHNNMMSIKIIVWKSFKFVNFSDNSYDEKYISNTCGVFEGFLKLIGKSLFHDGIKKFRHLKDLIGGVLYRIL